MTQECVDLRSADHVLGLHFCKCLFNGMCFVTTHLLAPTADATNRCTIFHRSNKHQVSQRRGRTIWKFTATTLQHFFYLGYILLNVLHPASQDCSAIPHTDCQRIICAGPRAVGCWSFGPESAELFLRWPAALRCCIAPIICIGIWSRRTFFSATAPWHVSRAFCRGRMSKCL